MLTGCGGQSLATVNSDCELMSVSECTASGDHEAQTSK